MCSIQMVEESHLFPTSHALCGTGESKVLPWSPVVVKHDSRRAEKNGKMEDKSCGIKSEVHLILPSVSIVASQFLGSTQGRKTAPPPPLLLPS